MGNAKVTKKQIKRVGRPKTDGRSAPHGFIPAPEPLSMGLIDKLESKVIALSPNNGTKAVVAEVFGLAREAFKAKGTRK